MFNKKALREICTNYFTPRIEKAGSVDRSSHVGTLLANAATKYRPDIDGLRAIAVIPVIFFHAGFRGFGGGFVGVDVFFVISGYLITSLILPEVLEDKFSIANFYERRIRRIFPALFIVLLASLVAGFWLMWPLALKDLGQSIIAATFFTSNILFWRESGYFDTPPDTKPLLHTWSLAVEEQFYILFPIYLLLAVRWFPSSLKRLTIAIALLSFGVSIIGVSYQPFATFYLAPTRGWELLLGSLLTMGVFPVLRSRFTRAVLCLGGLALIGSAVLFFSKNTPFPGVYALIPCIGTAMVIHAGANTDNSISRLLSARWLVFFGLISYPLYLWHWPLLVFSEIYLVRHPTALEAWTIILLCTLLSVLSWKYIEQPFRRRPLAPSRRRAFALAAFTMTVTASIGFAFQLTQGWPTRLPPQAEELAKTASDCHVERDECNSPKLSDIRSEKLCRLGTIASAEADFILWGDSHGESLRDAISQAAILAGRTGLQITSEGCPPILGVNRLDRPDRPCVAINEAILKVASETSVRHVVIVARWALWGEGSRYLYETGSEVRFLDVINPNDKPSNREVLHRGLKRTLDALQSLHKKVIVMAPIPEIGWDVPAVLAMEVWQQRKIHSEPLLSQYLERNRYIFDLLRELQSVYGFKIIYPHQILCDQTICHVKRNGQPLYCDNNHLSKHGASYLVSAFEKALKHE